MNSPVQKIKERLSIEDVVSSYIKLDRAGVNLKARCPFHNEKTPSFFVSPERGSYYCFGCGVGGDIFTFVEQFEGLDFRGALKLLANKAGVPLEAYSREMKEAEGEKERLYKALEESAKYFSDNLNGNNEVLEYLKKRGLNNQSIKDFEIGFAQNDWRLLYSHLQKKGFTDIEIEKAGLAKKPDDKSKAMYDRFRGRIMFPINDTSGRVIAFSGRIFEDDLPTGRQAPTQAKYLNSPETPIFNKSAVLYGLDRAKESIRKNNFSILVEGQMDLILSHQAGYRNTVATSGTALSDATISRENVVSNLGIVRRLSPNIVLAFDGDAAGAKAVSRGGRIALSLGMDVKAADLPEGKDPADLIKAPGGTDLWREKIKGSKHVIEFMLTKILENSADDTRKAGREIKEKILPFVDALESSIEKTHFLKKISDLSGIPQSALQDDLKKIEKEFQYEKEEIEQAQESIGKVQRKDYILRKLFGITLWQKSLSEPSLDINNIMKELEEILKTPFIPILDQMKENAPDLIFEAEVFYGSGADLKKDTLEMITNLKEEHLKEELEQKMRELYKAEEAGDTEKSTLHLKECQVLSNKIQEIKNGRLKK